MKHRFFISLLASLVMGGEAVAQKVLLPYGQETKEAWDAKYFYAQNGGETPPENWFTVDFDDSEWGDIQGPLALNPTGIWKQWENTYSTYWLRREFEAKNISLYPIIKSMDLHDDAIEIYLNGTLIYSSTKVASSVNIVELDEEKRKLLVEGKNVLAVKATDLYGGDCFVDFGLYAYDTPDLINPNFNSNLSGWVYTGDGIVRGGQSYNYLARSLSQNPFDVHQTISNATKGLYRVRVQAFEGCVDNDIYKAWNEFKDNKPVQTYIYAGETRYPIKNIFDEAVVTNIYRSNEFYKTPEGTYVPQAMTSTSIAFSNGMYENEFYAYVDTTTFDVGICMPEAANYQKWQNFDNFRLDFINSAEMKELTDDIANKTKMQMEAGLKKSLSDLASQLSATTDYEAIGKLIADNSDTYVNACTSVESYARLNDAMYNLKCRLDTGTNMTAAAVAEANLLLAETQKHCEEGTANDKEIKAYISRLNNLENRLGYLYVDVDVPVPGSMGDSILAKVDYFADVQSIKISGTLDANDIAIIQTGLTNLREIDMTEVRMTALPNRMFYNRAALEIVKLPAILTSIGDEVFYKCYALVNMDFPASLKSIGGYAFYDCNSLQQVVLPEGFTSLGVQAFFSCDNSAYLKLPSTLTSISDNCFSYNYKLQKIDFSEGLTHINRYAFRECTSLTSVQFPNSLYFIGDNAFAYNYALTDIGFNEGLYQIGDNAFYHCDALCEVTLPSSLVLAFASPFDYCDNLRKVTCLSLEPPYMTDQIPLYCSMEGRELYVPALSINTYKQTTGWSLFTTVKPIDYLPENFTVLSNFKLTLPETIPAEYKPNVDIIHDKKGSSYYNYGSLTVNGAGTISMSSFRMIYDPNWQYIYPDRNQTYCSLVNNSHLRADKVSISLVTRNDRWNFISFPYNVKMSEIDYPENANWVVRRYDGEKRAAGESSSTWVRLGNDDILEAGKGYIIQSSRYIGNNWQEYTGFSIPAVDDTHKNDIFQASDAVVQLNEYESEFAHNRSWNLIGNPYPCYYDTRFMDFDAPITVWNMNNNTYTAYSPADDSYVLLPGEAFFVQRPVDSESITFGKEGRQTNRTVRTLEAPARVKAAAGTQRIVVNLTLSDGTTTDRTRLVANEAAGMGYDISRDANKFFSLDPKVPQLYSTQDGIAYAINERPMQDGNFQLTARVATGGIYTIALDNVVEGYEVILEDNRTGKLTVLGKDSYVFTVEDGQMDYGFTLRLQTPETTGVTVAEGAESKADDIRYRIDGIKAEGSVRSGLYIQDNKKVIIK